MAERLDRINLEGNSWTTIFPVDSPHIYQLKCPLEKFFFKYETQLFSHNKMHILRSEDVPFKLRNISPTVTERKL